MRYGKRLSQLFLPISFCLVALLFAACGGGGPTTPGNTSNTGAAPDSQQVLRWDMGDTDISTFDPALSQDTASDFAIKPVFTGLVGFNNKLEVVDQLAAKHEVSADGLTYTFTLRDGLKFSNGDPLTSSEVVYSINRTLLPATKSPVAYYLSLIKDYDKVTTGKVKTLIGSSLLAPDPKTVKIIISKPAAYFLAALTYDCAYTVNPKLIDKYKDKWTEHLSEGAGAGPWKVVTWSHQKGITFEPNASYYGPKPKLKRLEYLRLGDVDTNYKAYLAKQVDHSAVPVPQLEKAKKGKDFRTGTTLVITYFALNYLAKPFDNINVRKAFYLALDRDLLNTSIAKNTTKPILGFIPEGMPGYDASITGPEGLTKTSGDKIKAKQLMDQGVKELGLKSAADVSIKLTYYPSSATVKNVIATAIQTWQNALGVKITQETLDFPKLIAAENASKNNPKGLQMWRAGWQADYPDPQDWLSIFFQKDSDYNQFNYGQNNSPAASAQQAVQEKLVQADAEQDQAKRLQLYKEAHQAIINDAGVIPLWQPLNQEVIRTTVQGVVSNGLNIIPPDDWANIYISK